MNSAIDFWGEIKENLVNLIYEGILVSLNKQKLVRGGSHIS
jgi:hypothetical protein